MTSQIVRRMPGRVLIVLAVTVLAGSQPVAGAADERRGPRKPTNPELLASLGFEATAKGLAQALDSPKPFARIYALKIIAERNDASFLPQAVRLLNHEFIKVQLEAAKLLAQFDRAEGLEWLRSWEKRVGDDPKITADAAHVVLDAASALAARGDERLARQVRTVFRHESWAVRIHAARALGDFHDLSKPDLEDAWIRSADILIEALQSEPPLKTDVAKLYLQWLMGSVARQAQTTPRILEKFGELAAFDHAATSALRLKTNDGWLSKQPAKISKGDRK